VAERIFNNLIADLLSRGFSVRFQAKGKSMQPTIQEGEGIEVAPVEPSQIKQGDIILYQIQSTPIAHRVVAINGVRGKGSGVRNHRSSILDLLSSSVCRHSSALNPRYAFILRGDSSVSCDKAVAPQQILGKVVSVERNGRRLKLDSKRAKMLYQARLWTSRLKRAISRHYHPQSSWRLGSSARTSRLGRWARLGLNLEGK
jgi:hypothetical protein